MGNFTWNTVNYCVDVHGCTRSRHYYRQENIVSHVYPARVVACALLDYLCMPFRLWRANKLVTIEINSSDHDPVVIQHVSTAYTDTRNLFVIQPDINALF